MPKRDWCVLLGGIRGYVMMSIGDACGRRYDDIPNHIHPQGGPSCIRHLAVAHAQLFLHPAVEDQPHPVGDHGAEAPVARSKVVQPSPLNVERVGAWPVEHRAVQHLTPCRLTRETRPKVKGRRSRSRSRG